MPDKVEAFIFKTLEKAVPLFDKLDLEADFLKIIQKLHILTPAEICSKCMQHYAKKVEEHKNQTWFSKEFMALTKNTCHKYLNQTECDGIIDLYMPIFFEQYYKYKYEPKFACGSQGYCSNGYTELKFDDYYNEIMKDKNDQEEIKPTFKKGTYKVVQMTDNHYDVNYLEGKEGKCPNEACCHKDCADAQPGSPTAAGHWGYVGWCDFPERTVEEAVKFIASLEPEYILWTGDSNDHRIWTQNATEKTNSMKQVTEFLKKHVPKDIPIYPIYGNHELFPLDEYDFLNPKKYDLFGTAADLWKDWLDEGAVNSILKRGFYSMYNKKLNLKVIVIFTDLANIMNFYIMPNPVDPLNQLDWIREELYDAEKKNISVIIQGHIPMSTQQMQSTWSYRYQALIERFAHVIKGQFFGHTHSDYFSLFNSYKTKKPIGVQYVAPSLSTYVGNLPSIRVYEFDTETNVLVNIHNYRLDLADANKKGAAASPLQWKHATDYVSEFQLNNYTSLSEMTKLYERLQTDINLLAKYDKNYHQGISKYTVDDLKLDKNRYTYFCEMKTAIFDELFSCLKEFIAEHPDWEGRKLLSDFSKVWYYYKKQNEAESQ